MSGPAAWRFWAVLALCLGASGAAARSPAGSPTGSPTELVRDPARARIDYMLQCQGCHLPDGQGIAGAVPSLQGIPGAFLRLPEGRAFLVRVPGAANADLDDPALADLLNWILVTMSPDTLPDGWMPYTADEVGKLRETPLDQVTRARAALLSRLDAGY